MDGVPNSSSIEVREFRRFGYLMGGVACGVAGYCWYRGWPIASIGWGAVSIGFLTAGGLFPSCLASLHAGWMRFAALIGVINSRILLTLFFFGIVTPLGLLRRLVGARDPHFAPRAATSYWERKERVDFSKGMRHSF